MTNTIRFLAVLSVFAAAACVSNAEQAAQNERARVAAQAAHESIATMHAAIPAGAAKGEVFEYASDLPMPPAKKMTLVAVADGNVFEYH